MTEIYFIRHGQTAQNTAKRFQGHTDTNLDDTGRWQAGRVAARLALSSIGVVYTSDLARAKETAEPIARELNARIEERFDLREIDVGDATGMSKADLREHHPELFGADWNRVRFPNGESYDETAARMSSAAREIAERHPEQRVAVVTHGGAIRGAIAGLVGLDIRKLAGLFVLNTSITRIGVTAGGPGHLYSLNDAAHLEPWTTEGRIQ